MIHRLILTLLVALTATPVLAQSGCDGAIAQFRRVVDSDAQTGNIAKSVYNRIVPELGRITEVCRSGRDAPAMNALTVLKRRHGYR